MPTIFLEKGYRFFFFSREGKEPPHVHVEKGDGYAKFWLHPVALARSRSLRGYEITEAQRIIEKKKKIIEEKWHEYFARKD